MRLFNDVIDLGVELDDTLLTVINVLVVVHLCAFVLLLVVVGRNMCKSNQQMFIEQVKKLEADAVSGNKKNR
jgi:hypothetical protein